MLTSLFASLNSRYVTLDVKTLLGSFDYGPTRVEYRRIMRG